MHNHENIKLCIEAILSSGTDYLHQLDKHEQPKTNGNGIRNTAAPMHGPRKKLIDAATRLIQLATEPEEYLDHLASSVSLNGPGRHHGDLALTSREPGVSVCRLMISHGAVSGTD